MRFYKHNRLDEEFQADAAAIIEEFIQAVKGGYRGFEGRGLEFAIKWWMSDGKAFDCTWEEDDYEHEMLPALQRWTDENPEDREFMLRCIYPDDLYV